MNIDFEKIKDTIAKTAIKAKEKSGDMLEVAKSKYKLGEINSTIKDKYTEIGKLVYESDDEGVTSKIEEICSEIADLKAKAEDMQMIIDDILNKKQCDSCGEKVDKKHAFCPKCGCNFEE